jgi:hypothetical protein
MIAAGGGVTGLFSRINFAIGSGSSCGFERSGCIVGNHGKAMHTTAQVISTRRAMRLKRASSSTATAHGKTGTRNDTGGARKDSAAALIAKPSCCA